MESFNDWGEGGGRIDDSVPRDVNKIAPTGDGLHDPLHGRYFGSNQTPLTRDRAYLLDMGDFVEPPPKHRTQ